ncbi:hypothetical protein [Streptomyces sp. AGS-58]|uniref:hypothetical protein n=1 Tax=unclassified Streptomyces TaxID=2593676 RepID=UPI0035A342C6
MFARLLGRSKATREVPAAETRTEAEPAGTEAEAAPEAEPAEAKGAGQTEAHGPAVDGNEDGAARADAGTDAGAEDGADDVSEGAGIPRQQSAEEAADSEAGDGAHR